MSSLTQASRHLAKLTTAALVAVIVAVSLAGPERAAAQDWKPTRNVEFVVGVGTGGSTDLAARRLQQIIQEKKFLPTTMTVVNRPGGSNSLSWIYINRHRGDGHFIALLFPTLLTNAITGSNTLRRSDVTPIVMLFNESTIFLVNAESDIKTPGDLVARLRKDPGSVTVGISAVGSGHHLAAAQLLEAAGADPAALKTVVFPSGGEMTTALRGKHVDLVVGAAGTAVGQMEGGGIRALAIAAPARLTGALSQVPTWREVGLDVTSSNWRGIVGPRELGAAEVKYWESVFARVVETPEWKEHLIRNGWEDMFMTSARLNEFLASEEARFRRVFASLGLAQ